MHHSGSSASPKERRVNMKLSNHTRHMLPMSADDIYPHVQQLHRIGMFSFISATTSYISLRCSRQEAAPRHTPHQVCQIKSMKPDEIPGSKCSSLIGVSSSWLSQHMLAKLFGFPNLDGAISRRQICNKRCVDIPCKKTVNYCL